MVHDLRTVFPGIPIIALTDDPQKLSRAVAAGATVALPRSTPPDQLAKVVRRLISR
jgi:DNA-binding NarL/FixJ family response regulator